MRAHSTPQARTLTDGRDPQTPLRKERQPGCRMKQPKLFSVFPETTPHMNHDTAWSGQGPPRQSCVASFVASPLPTSGAGGAQEAHMMLARTTRLKPEMRLSTHTSKQLAVSPSANQRASGHTLLMSSVCQMLMESTTRSGVPGSRSARSSCRRDTSTTPYSHGGASPPLHNRSAHT